MLQDSAEALGQLVRFWNVVILDGVAILFYWRLHKTGYYIYCIQFEIALKDNFYKSVCVCESFWMLTYSKTIKTGITLCNGGQ